MKRSSTRRQKRTICQPLLKTWVDSGLDGYMYHHTHSLTRDGRAYIDFIRTGKEFVGFLEMFLPKRGIHLSLGNGSLTWLKGGALAFPFTMFIALFISLSVASSGPFFISQYMKRVTISNSLTG